MMMPSTSNLKQQVERNWLDLPSDVMVNILERIGILDLIENAQKVCTYWHKVCKNPTVWRVINMNDLVTTLPTKISREVMFKHAVDRSQGQLVDVTIVHDFDRQLFQYVADRSTQLRRLEIVGHFGEAADALLKFPLLEELNFYLTNISEKEIETVGRYCPMLKTLKVNDSVLSSWVRSAAGDWYSTRSDAMAIAIGKNLLGLRRLELIANLVTNVGLEVILDNCHHLETLDLRKCLNIDLNGDLGKKCCKQIKYLKLPNDSLQGCSYHDLIVGYTSLFEGSYVDPQAGHDF